jgi:hypothetical protein
MNGSCLTAWDLLGLFNCYSDPRYRGTVVEVMRLLEEKMAEIGDGPVHPKLCT